MFIQDSDVVDLKIYYKMEGHNYVAYTKLGYKKLREASQKGCKELKFKMKILTWGLYNDLQDSAFVDKADGERSFNFRIFKENRLKRLLTEWDAKDGDGNPVPVSENMIKHLAPSIAEAMLLAYDEDSYMSEEEEGNS